MINFSVGLKVFDLCGESSTEQTHSSIMADHGRGTEPTDSLMPIYIERTLIILTGKANNGRRCR